MADLSLTGKSEITLGNFKGSFIAFIRNGAYVRLNDIASLYNKRIDNWMRLDATKAIIEAFKSDPSYGGASPFKILVGRQLGSSLTCEGAIEGAEQGTWAHPDLAIEFARWANPVFGLWCNRQIRHLLEYGEVNLHHAEWTEEKRLQGIQHNRDDIYDLYGKRR